MKLRLYVLRLPDHLSSHPACFPSSKVTEVTVTKGNRHARPFRLLCKDPISMGSSLNKWVGYLQGNDSCHHEIAWPCQGLSFVCVCI